MFIRRQVFAFLLLLNFASSFCGTVPVDVDLFSDKVSDSSSDSSEEDEDDDIFLKMIILIILRFLESILVLGPENLNPNNKLDTKMALVGWVSGSNKHSESNFEESLESYTTPIWDSNEYSQEEEREIPDNILDENTLKKLCSKEDQSIISHSDIQYLIDEKAEILKIQEKIVNSYYLNMAQVNKKHKDDIEEYKKRFLDRPGHMLHVLDSITSRRKGLEPNVEEIESQLEQIQALEDNFNDVAKASEITLKQLDKYKKLCEINCDEIYIENRFGDDIFSNRTGIYCIRLKELNDYIDEKLRKEQAQYGDDQPLEVILVDEWYEKNISKLKNNLTNAAVNLFGMTMYKILSLQDDYHHFSKDLENVNISSQIHDITETTAQIGFVRIGLKRKLEKYRRHCMKCGNQRVKRNVAYHEDRPLEGLEDYVLPTEKIKDVVDELIQVKINEIRNDIARNVTAMFSELDEIVDDHNVVEKYVKELHKTQDYIDKRITIEKEDFLRLKSRIPEESLDKITYLSKQSGKLMQDLKSAELFIDQLKLK